MELFVISPSQRFINLSFSPGSSVRDLIAVLSSKEGIPSDDCYVKNNGRISGQDDELKTGAVYRVEHRLCGGKGGFGSMLRALGAQIEKTTNREACRDLSGRRLRDVNHEKEMAEWLKKQSDREAEKEQRRLEKLQRKLAEPKHYFTDTDYEQQCHDLSERLEDSVLKGMQASSSGLVKADEGPSRKRPNVNKEAKYGKKKCFWTGIEGLDDVASSEESSDESEGENSPSSSASCSSGGAVAAYSTSTGPDRAESQEEKPCTSSSSSSGSSSPKDHHENDVREKQENEDKTERRPNAEEITQSTGNAEERGEPTQTETSMRETDCPPVESKDKQPPQPMDDGPLDLQAVRTVEELEALGLDRLKRELMERGMKCGGTLQERAARLFSIRGLTPDQIDPALLASSTKGKKK
ncbi:splicing regulator SDE2 isoform X2 [Chanos chanos]|uniref:Replication stress response regulator SDE2 n=1 Tax=Chanos chanos TaxID=29144 RepID=A0A6J2V264_CHACN|nr:replication stress response regulator SDE2 isoform X2 [Chanos chanos]